MILSDSAIKKEIEAGNIVISDFDESRLNPNSYNLRLGDKLVVYTRPILDPKGDNPTREIIIPPEGKLLRTDTLYLGTTMEYTESQKHAPMLEGRSSIGRLGLFVHVTAGFGDVGFCGHWTLEIHALKPIWVYPGMELCQISYHTVEGDVERPYKGKYQGQVDPVASRMWKEIG